MKILYAVQATGNGHITRARALLPALKQQGIEVDFFFSGRAKERLFDMQCFGDYQLAEGFTFVTQEGKVKPGKTLQKANIKQFWVDVKRLDLSGYDLLLNDFEPVSAWAAKQQKIPSLGLAHQYALRYSLPGIERAYWLKYAIDLFTPLERYLGVHWQAYNHPILPPLITQPQPYKSTSEAFILVYLPFEATAKVVEWLTHFSEVRFVIYADVPEKATVENIEIRPLCRQTFPEALSQSQGVICNTGFGLCSEALVLGKKILTKPLAGQIEQLSNARILEKMGRANVMTELNDQALIRWLDTGAQQCIHYPDVASAVAKWLASGNDLQATQLTHELWSEVKYSTDL